MYGVRLLRAASACRRRSTTLGAIQRPVAHLRSSAVHGVWAFVEVEKQRLTEKLAAHVAIEALGEPFLHRLPRRDEALGDTAVTATSEHCVASKLLALSQ